MIIDDLKIGYIVQLNDKWYQDNPLLANTVKIQRVEYITYDNLLKEHYINGFSLDYLEPVLITDEFLDKNKLWCFYNGRYVIYKMSNAYTIFLGQCGESHEVDELITGFNYIHEYQDFYYSVTRKQMVIIL